jgi:hypothetical protein
MRKRTLLCGAAVFGLAAPAWASFVYQSASPYTDTQGDSLGSTNGGRDIVGATITNDNTNLYITMTFNPTSVTNTNSNTTETPANIATSGYNYGIGITTGPGAGGDTQASADHGNPYGRAISIDSTLGGMTDWVGVYGYGTGSNPGSTTNPYTSYAFNDYVYSSSWTKVDTVSSGQPISATDGDTTDNTISLTVPIADFTNLTLTPGTTIYFDIYTTGSSGTQTAYDSLADQSATQPEASYSATGQYDGTVLDSYTIAAVPEPMSFGLLSCGGLLLLKRRSKT